MDILKKIVLIRADITKLKVDAIVNAANSSLLGGGGVDGCIHRAAGPKLLKECAKLGGCETGQSKITKGYKLPAKHIIHTVGPVGEKPEKLTSCYTSCLELVKEHELKTVAFCCISTGIYGYPNDKAAKVAFSTVVEWIKSNMDVIDKIIFCTFLEKDLVLYEDLITEYEKKFKCIEKKEDMPEDSKVLNKEEKLENDKDLPTEEKPKDEEALSTEEIPKDKKALSAEEIPNDDVQDKESESKKAKV